MNHIITISREFGSGGRTVGKKVAEHTDSLDARANGDIAQIFGTHKRTLGHCNYRRRNNDTFQRRSRSKCIITDFLETFVERERFESFTGIDCTFFEGLYGRSQCEFLKICAITDGKSIDGLYSFGNGILCSGITAGVLYQLREICLKQHTVGRHLHIRTKHFFLFCRQLLADILTIKKNRAFCRIIQSNNRTACC